MDFTSIGVKKYKLFENICMSDLKKVNVIIGKNNSGKSSLMDVVSAAYCADKYGKYRTELEGVYAETDITDEMIRDVFSGYARLGGWTKSGYSETLKGKSIGIVIGTRGDGLSNGKLQSRVEVSPENEDAIIDLKVRWQMGVRGIESTIDNTVFRRLSAERDIVPEMERDIVLSENGAGSTTLVRKIINESGYDELLIERDLLNALNLIMYPEAEFEGIRIQQIKKGENMFWEIYLQEKGMQRIPLSKTGSGLKTIILMLLNLLIVPKIEADKTKRYVYGFEELENNLHPAMQRKVFDYIYDYAEKNDVIIFLTTHSHVAINCFYDKENASIYHIEKCGGQASVKKIESYMDKAEILQDLDVKASDLLQSNGIIWVEGPSDRIYLKRWLEIFTDNQFEEGKQYQFLYYGGRLLSHYALPEEKDLISILTTNRNAAIIIDSDKKNKQQSINETKKRIRNEFDSMNMFSWITSGKEIENYIPAEAIRELFQDTKVKQCGQYDLFPQYISKLYNNFSGKKVTFANEIKNYITRENAENILDLEKKVKELYKHIASWNS